MMIHRLGMEMIAVDQNQKVLQLKDSHVWNVMAKEILETNQISVSGANLGGITPPFMIVLRRVRKNLKCGPWVTVKIIVKDV
ncbi:MAG: hypothetical protein GX625_21710 [Clostridiaceae bacterium]|nr:hypothetical protein [Clostridiaceae bacterium]